MTRRTARNAIRSSCCGLLLLGVGLLLAGTAHAADVPKNEDCLACHADKDLKRGKPTPGRSPSVFVDAGALKASTHAGLECVACHQTATAPHDEKLPPVNCAGCHDKPREALRTGVHGAVKVRGGPPAVACASCHGTHQVQRAASLTIDTCATCHASQVQAYKGSIHGRSRQGGDTEAATCRSCHGPAHTIVSKTNSESPVYHLNLPRTCAQCHADAALAKRHNIQVGNVYQLYMDSIHGRAVTRSGLLVSANCSDCHGSHGIRPRTDPTSRVFRANIPETCGTCHAGILKIYAASVHGKVPAAGARGRAAVCTDCHSAHQIRRVEGAPWQLDAIRECGHCHQAALKTYRETFHGKVTELGFTRIAKCADCHGSHAILPASDPRSTISPARLVETCRQCHAQASPAFVEFHPHADAADKTRFPFLHQVSVFMTLLLAGTFAFFGLHTLLWFPRSLIERFRRGRRRDEGSEVR
jgi:DnaJ-class molecular chaperone